MSSNFHNLGRDSQAISSGGIALKDGERNEFERAFVGRCKNTRLGIPPRPLQGSGAQRHQR